MPSRKSGQVRCAILDGNLTGNGAGGGPRYLCVAWFEMDSRMKKGNRIGSGTAGGIRSGFGRVHSGSGGRIRSTTVICVRRNGQVVMAADGQVTLSDHVLKHSAKKIRRLFQDKILAGFAGSTADAFNLFQRFETKLEQYAGNLNRAAVELAKDWRTDKMLRNLEALLVVADRSQTFLISGSGDVIDPDEPIAAIGSGGAYATAAARALMENTELSALEIAQKAMKIAGDICIYTNDRVTIEELKG